MAAKRPSRTYSRSVFVGAKEGVDKIVVTDGLARSDPIVTTMAITLGVCPWLAPMPVVEGIPGVAGLVGRPAKLSAAMLTRWLAVATLRAYLRSASPPTADRQFTLW